jgi:predicted transcriptional regulator
MVQAGQARLVKFIGSSTVRRGLLERLVKGPLTPTELATLENKHVSHVSRALREMKDYGLVAPMRGSSKEKYYRMTTPGYLAFAALARIS